MNHLHLSSRFCNATWTDTSFNLLWTEEITKKCKLLFFFWKKKKVNQNKFFDSGGVYFIFFRLNKELQHNKTKTLNDNKIPKETSNFSWVKRPERRKKNNDELVSFSQIWQNETKLNEWNETDNKRRWAAHKKIITVGGALWTVNLPPLTPPQPPLTQTMRLQQYICVLFLLRCLLHDASWLLLKFSWILREFNKNQTVNKMGLVEGVKDISKD